MSFALIPFDQHNMPVVALPMDDEFSTGQKHGFPVISISGKVFAVSRSGVREMVKAPGTDAPAPALEVLVVRASPGLSKTYYATKYVQGSVEKPTCYSADGKTPAEDAQQPQSPSCQTCVHNQWGSRITEDGKKAKSCADVKRLAVAPLGTPDDAMMMRIPAASLKAWDEYVAKLRTRGLNPTLVATKVAFDYSVTYPALTFTAIGVLPPEANAKVNEMRDSEVVRSIVDASLMEVAETEIAALSAEIPFGNEPAKVEAAKVEPAKKPAAKKPAPKVETLEEVVAKAAAEAPIEIVVEGGDDITAELDELAELSFDD